MEKENVNNRFSIATRSGEIITLSKDIVKKYLTNNAEITDAEFNMFFQLCKVNKVNPFLREAYIIKYGATPATIVMDYKVLQQMAEENPNYDGMKHGVIVTNKDGATIERVGAFVLDNETLIGGWCEVFRKDKAYSTKVVAMLSEFENRKKDGTLNSNWATKKCFMITKVAKAQALREAFPNQMGTNIYTPEEMESVEKPKKETSTNVENRIVEEPIDAEVNEDLPNFNGGKVPVEEDKPSRDPLADKQ